MRIIGCVTSGELFGCQRRRVAPLGMEVTVAVQTAQGPQALAVGIRKHFEGGVCAAEQRVTALGRRLEAVEQRVGRRLCEVRKVGVPAEAVAWIADVAAVLDHVRQDVDVAMAGHAILVEHMRFELAQQPAHRQEFVGRECLPRERQHGMRRQRFQEGRHRSAVEKPPEIDAGDFRAEVLGERTRGELRSLCRHVGPRMHAPCRGPRIAGQRPARLR